MFDGVLRNAINPALDALADTLVRRGVGPDAVTIAGFVLALGAAAAITGGYFASALALIGISRLCDGLDGAVAKKTRSSDFGGFLDIVLDFAFYGLIPMAFAINDPAANGVAAAVLLTSFYVNGASFLAFSVIAEKRGLTTSVRGGKSFFFTTGLAEAGETFAVFALFCLFPQHFSIIAGAFAAVCFWTAFVRILQARRQFRR
jgi:phosphatidylglycerophosphate synthase